MSWLYGCVLIFCCCHYRYDFPASFLTMDTVGTELMFKVGEAEVPNFRMIER
jgi:hypothetical protein